MRHLDAVFFDSPWLMSHKDWFDVADCGPTAATNRYQATPIVLVRRVAKGSRCEDRRLEIYGFNARVGMRPQDNIMMRI